MNQLAPIVPVIKNPKHKLFADTYLAGKNASDAAIAVGYKATNVGVTACRLLKQPEIAEYVRHMQAQSTEQTVDIRARINEELSDMAFFNVKDLLALDGDGNPHLDLSNITRAQAKAITKVETKKRSIRDSKGNDLGTETSVKIGLADKTRNLELLAKMHGLLKEPEVKVTVDVADRLLAARARVRGVVVDGVARRLGASDEDSGGEGGAG